MSTPCSRLPSALPYPGILTVTLVDMMVASDDAPAEADVDFKDDNDDDDDDESLGGRLDFVFFLRLD
jgi:hypothetical protein